MDNPVSPRNVVQISKEKFIIFVLVVIALVGFFMLRPQMIPVYEMGIGIDDASEAPRVGDSYDVSVSSGGMMAPEIYRDMPYPYPDGENTIEDTREFLKLSYNAQIKTRDVGDVVGGVQSTVRTVDGRVDSVNSSEKYGYVSFVVPKSTFYEFREEIRGLAHTKLVVENVSSQNLLGEKQNIEQRQETLTETLTRLQGEKSTLTAQHTQRLASINANISATEAQLASVRQQIVKEKDSDDLKALRAQETALVSLLATLSADKTRENTSYAQKSSSLDSQIASTERGLERNEERDEEFGNKVETVTGYVSVQWASWWEISKDVSPIHPGWVIAVVVLILWRYLYKRGTIPAFQLV